MSAPTIPTVPALTHLIDPDFVREARARALAEIEPQLEKLARINELSKTLLSR
jgi:hypothetical protein